MIGDTGGDKQLFEMIEVVSGVRAAEIVTESNIDIVGDVGIDGVIV